MSKKPPIESDVPEIEQAIDNFEVPLQAEPVNHVQVEDNYELPSIEPAKEVIEEVVVEQRELDGSAADALRALATNRPRNTTGFEVDAAVERFLSSDDKHMGDVAALKYRLECLAAEADTEVGEAIAAILKVVG